MAELASTLNRPVDPFNVVGQIARKPSVTERGAEARRQLEPTMRAESQATGEAMRAEAAAARGLARQAAGVEEQAVQGMERAGASLAETMAQYPQRQVQDFDPDAGLELAGMTALLGAFAGAVSGRAALTSMKGITEGYRAGKQDLYQREVAKYEADVQQFKDKVANAKTIYDNAIKLETQRRGAGLAKLKELEPLLQDSVISAKVRANDFVGAGQVIQNAMKLADDLSSKLTEATAKAAAKAAEKKEDLAGAIKPPTYKAELEVDPSGVPLAARSPYEGISRDKNFDAMLNANLKEYQATIDRVRQESDKNSKLVMLVERAEGALKRMTVKAFKKAQEEGKIPKDAVLDLNTLAVKGGGSLNVTGGALGMPIIGEFLQQILTSKDADASLFRTAAAEYQRGSYVPGEGQISNFERELFKQQSIDLGRPVATNLDLIRATQASARRQMERMKFFEDYFQVNRTIAGAEQLWRAYSEANRFVTVDAAGNVRYNPNTPSYQTWFKSKVGQDIGSLAPMQAQQPAATQQQGQSRGSLTADEVREQATLNNISVEEAAQRLRDRGYDIEEDF